MSHVKILFFILKEGIDVLDPAMDQMLITRMVWIPRKDVDLDDIELVQKAAFHVGERVGITPTVPAKDKTLID